jgi:transcriptional regulator with XRE-family HTH domain
MEQTLGKRIAAHRKRIGLTQETLAEQLNVTAQAVSKWENDQSCPDITTLPKLCEIFGISTDELLGHHYAPVHHGEVVDEEEKQAPGVHIENNGWEFHWDGGRANALTFALFVLLVGVLYFLAKFYSIDLSFWSITWPSALLVFGLRFLFQRFSFFSIGCALFGGYTLVNSFGLIPWEMPSNLIFPAIVVLFGLSLLVDALRKPKKSGFHITKKGKNSEKTVSSFQENENSFHYDLSFGEATHQPTISLLQHGSAQVSFGSMTVDLTQCGQIAPDCNLELNCNFGELELKVPRTHRIESSPCSSFGSVNISGQPEVSTEGSIYIDASVSFGEISIEYV